MIETTNNVECFNGVVVYPVAIRNGNDVTVLPGFSFLNIVKYFRFICLSVMCYKLQRHHLTSPLVTNLTITKESYLL
jgi:hypothetical protein